MQYNLVHKHKHFSCLSTDDQLNGNNNSMDKKTTISFSLKLCLNRSCFLNFQNVNAIEVSVPVGNSDHTTMVVGLTTFIVSGGTVYLLVTLFRTVEMKKK